MPCSGQLQPPDSMVDLGKRVIHLSVNSGSRGTSIENITDTQLKLTIHPVSNDSSSAFRYSTDNLQRGYFVLNVVSNWDKLTLQQDHEIINLHRFIIQIN